MKPPDELISAFKQKRGGIFVGAGLSIASGLPTWNGMLREMIARAAEHKLLDKPSVSDCKSKLKKPAQYLMLASFLRHKMGDDFGKYIDQRFADESLKPNNLHRAVIDLPWEFILTTNYDRLIERAYNEKYSGKKTADPILYKDPGSAASSLFREKPFVLKVHGDAKLEPENVILTERDYRNIIYNERGLQSLLQTLFTTYTILFVGASLEDPDLKLLLGYVHSAFHGKTPLHYAIVSEDERGLVDEHSFYHDFNLRLITYQAKKRDQQVLATLKALKRATA